MKDNPFAPKNTKNLIYLDYNATTPLDPQVLESMLPFLKEDYGNAHSVHALGKKSFIAVEKARIEVANLINTQAHKLIFTSGATEAINLTLQGFVEKNEVKNPHIITIQTAHKALLNTCQYLEKKGVEITYARVNEEGILSVEEVEKQLKDNTVLVALMHANNETGVIQPIEEVAELLKNHRAFLFCDATQSIGKIPVSVNELDVDFMAFSAHKLYGPKGIGALYLKEIEATPLNPLLYGGGHEQGLRSGTLNIPAIVGFGKACRLVQENVREEKTKIQELKNELESKLLGINAKINGHLIQRLPNTINIALEGINATMVMEVLQDKIAMATGSACTTNNPAPSHVLKAMGFSKNRIHSSIRLSLGRFTTAQEVEQAANLLIQTIKNLR